MNPYLKKYGPGGETNNPYDPTTSYIRPKKVTIDGKQMSTYSNEYRDLYNSGTVLPVYEGLPTVYAPEVEVTAQMTDKEREKRRVEAQGRVAEAVRKGTGSFARPILDTGFEMSGAAGAVRFAQDPLKNLKGTANVLSYTNLPGLIGHGIDYARGNPFFNVTEEDLQGLGNTLDVAGLATFGAGTAFKMAPKAMSSIPRMFSKIPNVNPNMGLRFVDESIDAQKALREAEELALKQKQPIKYELPTSNDPNVGPFSKYIEEYDKSGLAQWDAKQLNKDAYEELKNAYRKEFESNWGKKYDEKDLLTYAKIKEGISPSNNPFYDEDFLNLNNQFVKDFDVKDITDLNQKIALSAYTSGRFRGFNQSLTSGHNLPFYKEFMNPFLDDALKQNALEKDLSLIRGFGNQKLKVIRNDEILNDQSIKSVLPGDLFSSPSYQSTGLVESPHFFDTKKIIAPKGTNFGYANKQGLSYVPAEMEVTLPRNTMYEVLDDKTIKVIKDQGQGILPESSMSTVAKASDDVVEQMPNAKNIEEITTYKNDLLNRLKTTEEGKRRLANLGLTPEDLNDIDLVFNQGPSMAKKGFMDVNGNPFVNINFKS